MRIVIVTWLANGRQIVEKRVSSMKLAQLEDLYRGFHNFDYVVTDVTAVEGRA